MAALGARCGDLAEQRVMIGVRVDQRHEAGCQLSVGSTYGIGSGEGLQPARLTHCRVAGRRSLIWTNTGHSAVAPGGGQNAPVADLTLRSGRPRLILAKPPSADCVLSLFIWHPGEAQSGNKIFLERVMQCRRVPVDVLTNRIEGLMLIHASPFKGVLSCSKFNRGACCIAF